MGGVEEWVEEVEWEEEEEGVERACMQAPRMSFHHLCGLWLGGRGTHCLIQRIAWWVLGDLLQWATHWGHGVLTPGSYTVPGKWAARDLGMLYHNHQQLERGTQMGGGNILGCHHSILSLQVPHTTLL